jgi:hypothetical protein
MIDMGQAGETDVDAQVGDDEVETVEVGFEEDKGVEDDKEEYDTDDSDSDHSTVDSNGDSLDCLTFLLAALPEVDKQYELSIEYEESNNRVHISYLIEFIFPIEMYPIKYIYLHKPLFFPQEAGIKINFSALTCLFS